MSFPWHNERNDMPPYSFIVKFNLCVHCLVLKLLFKRYLWLVVFGGAKNNNKSQANECYLCDQKLNWPNANGSKNPNEALQFAHWTHFAIQNLLIAVIHTSFSKRSQAEPSKVMNAAVAHIIYNIERFCFFNSVRFFAPMIRANF